MKKSAPYIVILLLLLAAIFYLFIFDKKPSEEQERNFAITDFENLDKIVIKDRNAEELTLTNENNNWKVNGKYEIRSSMLNELKKTVTTMEVVSVVPEVAKDNILKEMISRSSRVSFFKNGNDKPFKVYIVGGPNHEQDGTHVLMEIDGKAASTPYIAKIPGRRGFFTYNFIPTESEWRTLQFTKLLPQEIMEIQVNYFDDDKKNESFSITRDKGNFTLKAKETSFQNDEVNTVKAQNLFSAFTNLNYESYQDDFKNKDSIMVNLPFGSLSITTNSGYTEKLDLFKMPLRTGDRMKEVDGKENEFNIEKLYAYHEKNNIFATIQFYTFKDILLQASDLKK